MDEKTKRGLLAFVAGGVFSVGLVVSGMTRPGKVLAFLDFFGAWDPSLAFVMVGAIAVSAAAFRAYERREPPGPPLPPRTPIDARLLAGAALFGVGWGLSGLCPGPAIVSLASGRAGALAFFAAMIAAMALYDRVTRA